MRLNGKVAVVTGAAAGIGRAIAARYAKEGARLVLGDFDEPSLQATTDALRAEGADVVSVLGNIAVREDVERLLDRAVETHGRLDILVNNAGVLDGLTPLEDASDELFERVMAVNLRGPFLSCRKALSIMLPQGGGSIINIASLAGIQGGRGGSVYTMSKHGVVGLTKSIAFYYGERGILSNAICPGGIETEIFKRVQLHETGLKKASAHFKTSPRQGRAEEIASCALFLASGDASYVNGTTLVADGGWTAH